MWMEPGIDLILRLLLKEQSICIRKIGEKRLFLRECYLYGAQWLRGGNNPKQKIIKNCQFFSFIPFSKAIVTRSISLLSQNLLKSTYNIQQLEIIIIFLRFRKKFRKFNTSYIDIIDTIFYIWYSFSHFEIFIRYQIIISQIDFQENTKTDYSSFIFILHVWLDFF